MEVIHLIFLKLLSRAAAAVPAGRRRLAQVEVVVAVEAVEAPQRRGVDVLREREEVGPAPPDRSERRVFFFFVFEEAREAWL